MKKNLTFILFALSAFIFSCKKESTVTNGPGSTGITVTPVDSTIAPASFDFKTTKTVTINISLASMANEPIAGVPVDILANDPNASEPLLTAATDASGTLHAQVELPAYMDTLIVDAKYIGLMRNAKAVISNNSVSGTIGGAAGFSGSIVASNFIRKNTVSHMLSLNSFYSLAVTDNTTYQYMGPYDSSGVPKSLVPSDAISSQLLSFVNASLPETIDVRKLHPEYLTSTATADLNITKDADVWITFVSEGAGYLNSIGYYTYPTGTPPQTPADIKTVTYIFPNASFPGSGGNLNSGNKVKLGKFGAGTSIGFVLFANGWDGGAQKVNSGVTKFYSTTACNPETNPDLKRHTVLLNWPEKNIYLIGFDDQNRQTGGSDNDFNDVIFYATSNPPTAISNYNVAKIDEPIDTDGDGVPDNLDAFPTDASRAYINYYPSKTGFGTVLFEDLWPSTGDYDLNDLVVGYHYKIVTNAQNLAVEMFADYAVQASGASYVSGFGVQLPFDPSKVKVVTGQKLVNNYIKQNANGTEAGQSKTVIIPFDGYNALIKRPGGYYINTQNGAPYIKGDTAHVYMSFTTPISASTLGNAPFNPFLISNQRRGYEVHLPNNVPTDLADKKLLGTSQDVSNPVTGTYYKTKNSWPFALNFSAPFNYSAEGVSIGKSYNYFFQWAKSGGAVHSDWYLNQPGYFNPSLIYTH